MENSVSIVFQGFKDKIKIAIYGDNVNNELKKYLLKTGKIEIEVNE